MIEDKETLRDYAKPSPSTAEYPQLHSRQPEDIRHRNPHPLNISGSPTPNPQLAVYATINKGAKPILVSMNNTDPLPLSLQTRSNDLINILDDYRNDEYCGMLLALFCVKHPKNMGFNEIRRQLATMTKNVNTSPNALNKHLKHLIDNEVIQKLEDKDSKLKIKPIRYSLTPAFIELGKDLFIINQGLDVELLKEELGAMSIGEASRSVAFILLNDVLNEVRDSLVLDPKIADFKQVLKSARTKVSLDAYSSVIKDSGKREEALKVLFEINKKLSSYVEFSEASE